jgi:hypothetical protein
MRQNKFTFYLMVLALVCFSGSLWAQNEEMSRLQQKECLGKLVQLLPPDAKTHFSPALWPAQEKQASEKIVVATGAISGVVTKAGGGGIAKMVVRAHLCECPSYSNYDSTDASGNYLIPNLPAGRYTVWTDNDSIFTDVYYDDKTWQTADTVTVGSGTLPNINFSLRVGAKITGLLTMTGAPYVSSMVYAIDTLTNEYYYTQPFSAADTATYAVLRLPTGKYRIKTYNTIGYIDEYFDDKPDAASATVISVTEGSTYSSKNITLAKGGIIKGTISSSSKGHLNHIQVFAYYVPNMFEWLNMTMVSDTSGGYRLSGLRSGAWKVYCVGDTTYEWEWYNNASSYNNAASVNVTPPDSVTGKDFSLGIGGSISGHVYDASSNPINNCQVIAFDSSFFEIGQGMRGTRTNSSGYYKIGGLRTGSYTVEASTECDNQFYNHKDSILDANPVSVTSPGNVTGINFNIASAVGDDEEGVVLSLPYEFELSQNYPNPFNPETKIEYDLTKSAQVNLTIYNLLGQKVKTLVDERQAIGSYKVSWDGKNEQGKILSSGIYFYRLEVNGVPQTKRMVLLK